MALKSAVPLLVVLAACLLPGCSGGSRSGAAGSTGIDTGPVDASTPGTDAAIQGFIVIEERLGKRRIDGWFSRQLSDDPLRQTSSLWQSSDEHCVQLALDDSAGVLLPDELPDGTVPVTHEPVWPNTLYVGESIDISSRTGVVFRLRAQRAGDAVVYASEEQWLEEALPADAVVSIPGATGIPWIEPVSLRPLEPLVREQPIDGVSTDLSTPIRWVSSVDADDFIELTVSQGDGGGWIDSSVWRSDDRQQGPVAATLSRLVRCELRDTGSFVLPDVVQVALPAAEVAIITLVRRRESVREVTGARLSILQSSYP